MNKKIVGIFVCSLFIIATIIPVAGNIKIRPTSTNMLIETSVDEISPYLISSSPLIITATGPSDLTNVALHYRWSKDNASWSGIQEYTIFEGFESGSQNTSLWNTYQTPEPTDARIRWNFGSSHSGNFACAMDDYDTNTGDYALNVIYTNLDFSDASNININFWEREWGDEPDEAPDSWDGWGNYDVVAFTNDGNTWYEIVSEAELNKASYTMFEYNISNDPDFSSPPDSNFAIAFQQYDNYQFTQDGRAWDDITFEYIVGAGIDWTFWNSPSNPDQDYPWQWYFNFPKGAGYYEFYSLGSKSGEPGETPPLEADAICRYNRIPQTSNEYPTNGSTDVELIPKLEISVSDADGETMDLEWYSNSSGTWQSFGNIDNVKTGTYNLTNSNFSAFETTYWWYLTVTDNIHTISSPIFHFTTYENLPPNTPSDPDPEDDETDVEIDTSVSWACNDPNGDNVTFDVYFGTSNPPPKVVSHQSEKTYDPPGLLNFDTDYYWKIVAWDEYDYSTSGPTWTFYTEENLPPNIPSDPSPSDGATDVSINKVLTWTGGDPNHGDKVTYDVYFGKSSPPELVGEAITQPAYDPGTMDLDETYYWKVVAEDKSGETATGPIWSFSTQKEPNDPPTSPDIYGPPYGLPGKELSFAFDSNDPDEDLIKFIIDWGDGDSTETELYPEGIAVEARHTYDDQGEYTITAKAEDEKGLVSGESTFDVTIKRTKSVNNYLLTRLFERFPMLERLLELIGLY